MNGDGERGKRGRWETGKETIGERGRAKGKRTGAGKGKWVTGKRGMGEEGNGERERTRQSYTATILLTDG